MSIISATSARKTAAPSTDGVSIPLYLGGLIVLLAGIYAVGTQLDEPRFTQFTVVMTVIGVAVSYFLRRLGVPSRWIKIGALGLCVVFLYALRGTGPFGNIVPVETRASQDMLLASALALTATFCSFLLVTDDAVVFTCVFTIALIGLTGTVNINQELIVCFVVFLGAAVFLLVQHNYLQNRPRGADGITGMTWQVLLRTQVLIALTCGFTAIVIGFLIAVPIQMAGKSLSLSGIIRRLAVPASASGSGLPTGSLGLVFDDPRRFDVGLGPLDDDQTIVLSVVALQNAEPRYWRGRTYEMYNGMGWESLLANEPSILERPTRLRNDLFEFEIPPSPDEPRRRNVKRYTFRFLPKSSSFFTLYNTAETRILRSPLERIIHRPADNTLSIGRFQFSQFNLDQYEIEADVSEWTKNDLRNAGTRYPSLINQRYLLQGTDGPASEALQQLADEATRGFTDPYSKAQAIERFVAQRCTYTLQAPAVPRNRDAAEYFLNESKEGYCDLYATAVAVLCRYAGLPARVVTGFAPGTPSEANPKEFILRARDKHAWAEVFFPSYGWVPFDATTETGTATPQAPAEEKAAQTGGLSALIRQRPLPFLLGGLGLLALLYVLKAEVVDRFVWRKRGLMAAGHAGEVALLYLKTTRAITRRGVARPVTMTPGAYTAKVRAYLGDSVAEPLAHLTARAETALYGPDAVSEADVAAARAEAATVRGALRGAGKADRGPKAAVTG